MKQRLNTQTDALARLRHALQAITTHRDLAEELLLNGAEHLWRLQVKDPHKTVSWYVENCLWHIRDVLGAGRSLDSPKRRSFKLSIEDCAECLVDPEDVLQNVCAHDLFQLLLAALDPLDQAVARLLYDGFGVSEIAAALHISHPAVIRHRRKLAAAALKLGVSPNHSHPRS
ncbi:MAG TPA: hypothetical protein VG146_02795 [Verrucomicrobiae bacterium]|nr:hypothetical protein [Verrucomicrobiae bacterium]